VAQFLATVYEELEATADGEMTQMIYRQVSYYISLMNEFVDAIQPRKTKGQYIKHNLHNMMHFNYDLIEQFGPC
jgi:hypothetical protein